MNKNHRDPRANGMDSLSLTLIFAAVLFLLFGRLAGVFYLLAAVCLSLGIWRSASHNLAARQAENYKFMHITGDVREGYERWRFRSQHCYFKCENCGANIAATPDLGDVKLVCPKCGHTFTAHT
ncbi:MAG: hypothetical protein ACOX66_01170 [Oscillospiraceae bacterium]